LHQTIGPFYDFTAVIGPNGSGKSNLMDAISFVLGVKTGQLRGSLKELLYYNSAGTSMLDKPRRGYVKLVFETTKGEEIQFSRVITPSGASEEATYQSQYRLNDRNVGWEAYNEKLKTFNILVKARNFLVFQVIGLIPSPLCFLSSSCLHHVMHMASIHSSVWPSRRNHFHVDWSTLFARGMEVVSTNLMLTKDA
jgi:energy-coupling factor transporter ATP-binding protein EcfA2